MAGSRPCGEPVVPGSDMASASAMAMPGPETLHLRAAPCRVCLTLKTVGTQPVHRSRRFLARQRPLPGGRGRLVSGGLVVESLGQ